MRKRFQRRLHYREEGGESAYGAGDIVEKAFALRLCAERSNNLVVSNMN